ncbi:MAG TPA: AraC family transcriptional regulator [Noviherbaspirillum sp.]
MDVLSRLLSLYPVQAVLDYRCQLAAPWRLDEPAVAFGVAPYHLIVEGTARIEVADGPTVSLCAGDIVMLPHGNAHCLRTEDVAGASPVRAVTRTQVIPTIVNDADGMHTGILCGRFVADGPAPQALLGALPAVILVRTAGRADLQAIRTLFALLHQETETLRPGAHAVASHLASALFSLVLRAWLPQALPMPGLFGLMADHRLQHAVAAILSAPDRGWSVDALARACHMSRATFARLFRQCAGATPGDMLARLRMAGAAQRLVRETRSIADIGASMGYQSEAAFHRVFKRHFGMGPGRYRRAHRKGLADGLRAGTAHGTDQN